MQSIVLTLQADPHPSVPVRHRADLEMGQPDRLEGKVLPSARLEKFQVDRITRSGHWNERTIRCFGGQNFERFDVLRVAAFDEDPDPADQGRTLERVDRTGQFIDREVEAAFEQLGRTVGRCGDDFRIFRIEQIARRCFLRRGARQDNDRQE